MIIVYLSPKKNKMRKLLPFIFFSSFGAFGQLVGGEMVASGRNIVTQTDFKLDGHNNGWAIYTLAVDLDGKVTSADLKESSLKSRLDNMDIRNHVMKLKFEKGTHYPKFHHVEVKITMVKSENPPELEIIID